MTSRPHRRGHAPELGRWVAAVLRGGTLAAVLLAALGYAATILLGRPAAAARPFPDAILAGGGEAVTAIGLLALTLTPLVMLAAAALAFHRAGEGRMTATALVVTGLLVASLAAAALLGLAS